MIPSSPNRPKRSPFFRKSGLGSPRRRRASSLITTLLVLVVLSTIVVAFMQSMSIERSVARSVLNKERAVFAAESGLSTALARIAGSTSSNFVVAQDRSNSDPRSWPTIFIGLNASGVPQTTNSLANVGLPVITNHVFRLATNIEKVASVHPVLDADGRTNGSFAFVVIDNTAKQNLQRYPAITPRGYTTTLREVPLMMPSLLPLSSSQSNTINTNAAAPSFQSGILSVASFNQFFATNNSPNASEAWAANESWAAMVAPNGQPKINLRKLKFYLDNLSVSQISGNPKSLAVEGLLGQSPGFSSNWGGGTLDWLISTDNPGRYTMDEARQIAANLIDYLDDDLHPTTDNVESPTYFGVEARFLPSGRVRGHPYVTAIGHGLVFNLSTASGFNGWLNSTRVLAFWSLVNPWSETISEFHTAYRVEMEVAVNGLSSGGLRGDQAQNYFDKVLNERLDQGPNNLPPYTGSTFPESPSGLSFANFLSFQPANRQPAGMSFSNVSFSLEKARLVFIDSDGRESAVQVLDNLPSVPMNPTNFTLPSSAPPSSRVYNPATVRNILLLSGDPRGNFRTNNWVQSQLATNALTSTNPPLNGGSAMFAGMHPSQGDGQQGVPPNWYTSTNLTNHFFVRSPAPISNPETTPYNPATMPPPAQLAVDSIAEIGYLWTGRPWQTLRMVEPTNNPFRKDYLLLGYLDAGTFPTQSNSLGTNRVNGQINVGTALRPTLQGLFSAIPNQSTATNLGAFFSTNTTRYPFINPGAIGEFTNMATPGVNTKFAREDLMRRVANGLTSRSETFTVFVRGEARDPRMPGRVISTANLTAEIRLVLDPANPSNPPNATIIRKTIH